MVSSGSGHGPVTVCCEDCHIPSGCIKGREFIEQLRDYQLLKGSTPCSYYEHVDTQTSLSLFCRMLVVTVKGYHLNTCDADFRVSYVIQR
jgi:hypothetical protein